jgi:hypothetical protein
MAHGPLPPIPILILPTEVVDELNALGLAETSRNPFGEFAAGDWWQGLLMFSGDASNAITLIGGIRVLPRLAKLLHKWNSGRSIEDSSAKIQAVQSVLSYRTATGHAVLDLNRKPSIAELTNWLTNTYMILEKESQDRR